MRGVGMETERERDETSEMYQTGDSKARGNKEIKDGKDGAPYSGQASYVMCVTGGVESEDHFSKSAVSHLR